LDDPVLAFDQHEEAFVWAKEEGQFVGQLEEPPDFEEVLLPLNAPSWRSGASALEESSAC
jgi:hypothetical protein